MLHLRHTVTRLLMALYNSWEYLSGLAFGARIRYLWHVQVITSHVILLGVTTYPCARYQLLVSESLNIYHRWSQYGHGTGPDNHHNDWNINIDNYNSSQKTKLISWHSKFCFPLTSWSSKFCFPLSHNCTFLQVPAHVISGSIYVPRSAWHTHHIHVDNTLFWT